ncbi:MAG TPA: PIG-L family deacetylase [Solirubrobacteraceae bacterium]|nr:PIG-L family deacetylase [Solirubrobacteraceae bacterium]
MRLLALAPHPDDEILGAGAVHIALARAGHEVLVYPVTLGRRADRDRRHDELVRCCRIAGLELLEVPPLDMSAGERDNLPAAAARLAEYLQPRLQGVDAVTSPSPRDVHPAHVAIAGAVARAMESDGADRRLWLWSIWGTLPRPTLWFPFGEDLLDHQLAALDEHRSQIARSDFPRLVRGRAEAASVLGPELLYGFGVDAPDAPYAELLCEVVLHHHVWYAGRERQLDPADPLGGEHAFHTHMPVGSWVR